MFLAVRHDGSARSIGEISCRLEAAAPVERTYPAERGDESVVVRARSNMSDPIYRSRSRRQHPSPTAVQAWKNTDNGRRLVRGKRLEYYVGSEKEKEKNLSSIFARSNFLGKERN